MTRGLHATFVALWMGAFALPAAASVTIEVNLPRDQVHVEPADGTMQVRVAADRFEPLADPGSPALPFRVVAVLLPQGTDVASFTVTSRADGVIAHAANFAAATRAVNLDGVAGTSLPLAPAASGGVFPGERGRLLGVGTLHGYTIASFAVFPLRVANGDLVWSEHLELRVETTPSTRPIAVLERKREEVRERARAEILSLVDNPQALDGYVFSDVAVSKRAGGFQATPFPSLEGSPVDYLIVTPDSLAAAYQVLADFKTKKGVPTVVRTIEWIRTNTRNGADPQETIRNFVIEAYAKWGITYLMLGGDTEQVPARFVWSGFYDGGRSLPADMYFGCLDGDWNSEHDSVFGEELPAGSDWPDLFAEVYVGRMPTRSVAEVGLMTSKIIAYETPAVPAYTNSVLFLAEVLFPMNWSPPQEVTLNGADLTEPVYLENPVLQSPGMSVTRMYETNDLFPGSVAENKTAAMAALNAGYGHTIHVGHGFRFTMSVGASSIQNSDADALVNGNKLTCLYFLNCSGVAFDYPCLAEHFLRNPNGGAITAVGANESAFPNASANYMDEYYHLLFTQNVYHAGETFARSRLPRTVLAVLGDNIDLWTHYIYSLLGDPELPMWNGAAAAIAVAHTGSVNKGQNSIAFTVTSGGNPVSGATVCLSKGEEDYATGVTNGSGQVTIPFRAETSGFIDVAVTGRNLRRYSGTITVGGTGAYLAIDGITLDDDNSGGTSGNGNGVIDGGETVDFHITVRNNGNAATAGVVDAVLRTSDPGVTLLDSTATAGGAVGAATSVLLTGGMRVAFEETLADEYAVPFKLAIKDGGVITWNDTFKKEVHEPVLSTVRLRIDDTATGNGNGVVDAGEQFKLFVEMKNFGTGSFPGGVSIIADLDNGFAFVDSVDSYGVIASMASGENLGGFVLTEPSVASEHRLGFFIADTYGRVYVDTLELRPPLPPSSLVINPSLGSDRLQVTWNQSTSPDRAHYRVYRATAPGGPFTLASADPVAHAIFVDIGLAPNTIYYYRVTTLDEAGNESVVSATMSGSTNPEQLSGWPQPLDIETAASPAVGDLNGDGDLEVVVVANKVYAWHHDGAELVDGDGDPQTWGVLSNLGGVTWVSHPALGRIDNVPGLDIVASSRDTKQVFVFNANGQVVAGWPRTLENTIRAGLVVGDINDDGLNEVIAVDESGVVYVFNRNGTEFIDGDANPVTQGVFFRMQLPMTFNYSTPCVADVDNDGKDEIVVGSQSSRVYVLNDNATVSAGWPYVLSTPIAGSPAVGDVDNNGDLEIVVFEAIGNLRVLNHDGTQLMNQFFANGSPPLFFNPSPVLGNVQGDGKLEIFVPTKPGKVHGIQSNGVPLVGWPVTYSTTAIYTESSPVIVDVDGNGVCDVVLGDESQFIRAWGLNGQVLAGFPLATGDAMRGVPTVTDLDENGSVDLVAAGWDKTVHVWDFAGNWNPATAPWPRFHANLHNNGRLNYAVPTPVGGVSFSFARASRGVALQWIVPDAVGGELVLSRAEVTGKDTGEFARVSKGLTISPDGLVRWVDATVEEGERYSYRLESSEGTVVHETGTVYVPVRTASLGQNYPNPFNPTTRIEYRLPEGAPGAKTPVSVVIYDVRGAKIRELVNGAQAAGKHTVDWDGRNDAGESVGSGVYFYRMQASGFSGVRKMVLLK